MTLFVEGNNGAYRVDYLMWLQRLVGWDALLPIIISAGAITIARLLQQQPPADILALVGLPVAAFIVRFTVGYQQVRGNNCGDLFRMLQFSALLLALSALILVDFFVALVAFVPVGNGPPEKEVRLLCSTAVVAYLGFMTVAMFPGRQQTNRP